MKADRVEVLPHHVRRVPVEPERRRGGRSPPACARGPVVVGDLARVHLVGEPHAHLVVDVEDRVPAVGEVLVAGLDGGRGHRREHRDVLPDGRAGEADDDVHAELGGGPGRVGHPLGGPLPDPLGIAVAPDVGGQDVLVPLVDRVVADGLPDEVVGDRPHPQAVPLEDLAASRHVVVLGQGAVHLEVVAPAGDLEPVVPPGGGQPAYLLEGQVGPLSGEEGDRSSHGVLQGACGRCASSGSVRTGRWGPCGAARGAGLDRGQRALDGEPVGEGRLRVPALGDGRRAGRRPGG